MVSRSRFAALGGSLAIFSLIAVLVAGCGSSSTNAVTGNAGAAKGCTKIGVLMPESASSPRWVTNDAPDLQAAIPAALPGAHVDLTNANGDSDTQLSQAEADLTKGDCILVVAPHDSAAASAIVVAAHKSHVPVIAYDRLINDTSLDYYVSFDGNAVGVLQGQYIAANYQKYVTEDGNDNIVFIDGSNTDNNAKLFAGGAHSVVDPLVTAGHLKQVYEQYTPNWDAPTAQTEMEAALTANNNKVAVAYVSNDTMAGTVIAALTAQHLNGKVLVTGQDATVGGFQEILAGNQSMTVYKNETKEAQGTASIIAALSKGQSTASIATTTVAYSGTNIPSVLETPVSVDITNISSTVVADGFLTVAEICQGEPSGFGNGFCP